MDASFSGRSSDPSSSRAVWKEFQQLLDKSSHAFNRLRDIPAYGGYNWEEHFHKAFHVYSQLWKFQQDHRPTLTENGLRRSEIGDIASKIGQLYYNYYLRTSETRFLNESYVFYEAIRSRQYFSAAVNDASLAIKQLRYFARFIIICLLLNNREEVWQLLQEYQALINSYIMRFNPADAAEWRMVVAEVNTFMHSDVGIPLPRAPAEPLPFKMQPRCSPLSGEAQVQAHRQRLRDVVLVSYYQRQVKIAELPLDSYRMLLALEWEAVAAPAGPSAMPSAAGNSALAASLGSTPEAAAADGKPVASSSLDNPVKHLVYRPTSLQLLAHLGCVAEALPRDGILLVYLALHARKQGEPSSARSATRPITPASEAPKSPGGTGAARTESRQEDPFGEGPGAADSMASMVAVAKDAVAKGLYLGPSRQPDPGNSYLLPEDLLPLTRRRLMVIVDSDVSSQFLRLQNQERGTHMIALLSPTARPPALPDAQTSGSLLTAFLGAPLVAICQLCSVADPSPAALQQLEGAMAEVMADWAAALGKELQQSTTRWAVAFQDVLLRRVTLRFVLARALLQLHSAYGQVAAYQPACFPELPECMEPGSALVRAGVAKVAAALGCSGLFDCKAQPNGQLVRKVAELEISPC